MNFDNVEILGISFQNNKFDSDLIFNRTKTVEVTGFLLSLSNTDGVKSILKETNDLIEIENSLNTKDGSLTHGLQEIFINNVSFGEGLPSNFSVRGDHIQDAEYTVKIDFIESNSITELKFGQNKNNTLNFEQSDISEDDLKYLRSLSENFDFKNNGDEIDISHSVNCEFTKKQSLLPKRKNLWQNSTIQGAKLANLRNKGKGSIKVLAGATSSQDVSLDVGEYVLEFDYLGQNSNSFGDCTVSCAGESITLNQRTGRKKIEFKTLSSALFTINLIANSSNDTFFDNFYLSKKSDLPLEKSRSLSNFLLSSTPEYPIILDNISDKYSTTQFFDNFQTTENFDEVDLSYSISKKIIFGELDSSKNYSNKNTLTVEIGESGIITVTEKNEIKCLTQKTDSKLKNFTDIVESASRDRCIAALASYKDYYQFGCPTPTRTQVIDETQLYDIEESKSLVYNFKAGICELTMVYSNDPRNIKSTSKYYKLEDSVNIENTEGYQLLSFNGSARGKGDTSSERKLNGKQALLDFDINKETYINEIKASHNILGDFVEIGRTLSIEAQSGAISYGLTFSNKPSYSDMPDSVKSLVKKYDIEVSVDERIGVFNEFAVNCNAVAQVMGDLFQPRVINVGISVFGNKNVSVIDLVQASKSILSHKNLMFGLGSEGLKQDVQDNYHKQEFTVKEDFNYNKIEDKIQYNRSVLDLSQCLNSDKGEQNHGWVDLGNLPTPTPFQSYTYQYEEYEYSFTPPPEQGWNYDEYGYNFTTPIPFPTPTEIIAPTPTLFTLPTPTTTTTLTPTNLPNPIITTPTPTATFENVEVFIPENWNNTINNLVNVSGAELLYGKRCFDDSGSITDLTETLISNSYANTNLVKDCIRDGNGTRWYSLVFAIPSGSSFTPPHPDDGCEFFAVDIPTFYQGDIKCLIQSKNDGSCLGTNQNYIGAMINPGTFEYSYEQINVESKIINSSTNNSSHPYFGNGIAVYGSAVFQICGSDKTNFEAVSENFITQEILIPLNSSLTLAEEIINGVSGWSQGKCYEIIGYKNCSLSNEFNRGARILNKNEIYDNCSEFSDKELLYSVIVKEVSCGENSLNVNCVIDYNSPLTPTTTSTTTTTHTLTPTTTTTATLTTTTTLTTTITLTSTLTNTSTTTLTPTPTITKTEVASSNCSGCVASYDTLFGMYFTTCGEAGCDCSCEVNLTDGPDSGQTIQCVNDSLSSC